jgi:DNA-binding NtrC family response regulator
LHPSVLERLHNYSWPGNIRELRNVLERAVILAGDGLVLIKHLAMDPAASDPQPTVLDPSSEETIRVRPGASMDELEEAYINLILQKTNNNKTRAADILGISVRTLHNKLGQLTKTKVSSASS